MTSWTEMQTYMRCPRAWELAYVENLEAKTVEDKVPLIRGRAFHKVMEAHLLGIDPYVICKNVLRTELATVKDQEIRGAISDEIQDLYQYHANQLYMPAQHLLATAAGVFPDTYKDHGLNAADPMVEYKFHYGAFTGVVDAIMYDRSLKAHVIVDWKLRKNMSHPMDIQVDGQLQFYAACLNSMGANIEIAYLWEFRNAIPKPVQMTKKGTPNLTAMKSTTWEMFWDTLPYGIKESRSKEEWQEFARDRVKGKEEYAKAHEIPITKNSSELALYNAITVANMLVDARIALKNGRSMPAWLSSFGCRFCEFNKLCASPLQYGDDPTEMIEQHYTPRREINNAKV